MTEKLKYKYTKYKYISQWNNIEFHQAYDRTRDTQIINLPPRNNPLGLKNEFEWGGFPRSWFYKYMSAYAKLDFLLDLA